MRHLTSDPLPDGLYDPAAAAIIVYAQKSTRMEPITRPIYAALATHFSPAQIVDLCLTIGLSNMVNRFHATFLTDIDETTLAEVATGDAAVGGGPIAQPGVPKE